VWTNWFGGEEPMDFDGREADLIFVKIQLRFAKKTFSGDQTSSCPFFAPICFTKILDVAFLVKISASTMLLPQRKFLLKNKLQYPELHISLFIFPESPSQSSVEHCRRF